MYEIGRVYVWQNQKNDLACLNGTETTILGPKECFIDHRDNKRVLGLAD